MREKTLLVVDDDPIIVAAYVRYFSREWTVYSATDAASARRLVEADCPDVVIVDLRLGGNTGLELLRELKRDRPEVRVAVVSGYLTISAAVAAARLGADVVLAKPVHPAEIVRELERGPAEPDLGESITLARVEYEHIARVMDDCDSNISEAARRLGIHRHSLQRKLRKPAPKA